MLSHRHSPAARDSSASDEPSAQRPAPSPSSSGAPLAGPGGSSAPGAQGAPGGSAQPASSPEARELARCLAAYARAATHGCSTLHLAAWMWAERGGSQGRRGILLQRALELGTCAARADSGPGGPGGHDAALHRAQWLTLVGQSCAQDGMGMGDGQSGLCSWLHHASPRTALQAQLLALRLLLSFCHWVADSAIARGGQAAEAGRRLRRRLPREVVGGRLDRGLWDAASASEVSAAPAP